MKNHKKIYIQDMNEQNIIRAIYGCIDNATPEFKCIYNSMIFALQNPDIERYQAELRASALGLCSVSSETQRKAFDCVASLMELQIRNQNISEEMKEMQLAANKKRLKELEITVDGLLKMLGRKE